MEGSDLDDLFESVKSASEPVASSVVETFELPMTTVPTTSTTMATTSAPVMTTTSSLIDQGKKYFLFFDNTQ